MDVPSRHTSHCYGRSAEKRLKAFNADARRAQDRAQSTAIRFLVVGYDHLPEGLVAAENHVAAFLPPELKARLAECSAAFLSGDDRQARHTETKSASARSSGTGSRSASRAAT